MSLKKLLKESTSSFNNWVMPTDDVLKREFKVEHELKGKNLFDSEQEFVDAVKTAEVEQIDESSDRRIGNRSNTSSKEDLLNLIRSYRSYPEFRNEQTIDALYQGFAKNKPMEYPIVIEYQNGRRVVFSGNTRMDVAFQMNIEPNVLIVKVNR